MWLPLASKAALASKGSPRYLVKKKRQRRCSPQLFHKILQFISPLHTHICNSYSLRILPLSPPLLQLQMPEGCTGSLFPHPLQLPSPGGPQRTEARWCTCKSALLQLQTASLAASAREQCSFYALFPLSHLYLIVACDMCTSLQIDLSPQYIFAMVVPRYPKAAPAHAVGSSAPLVNLGKPEEAGRGMGG